ncbi:MAG TPA: hypothetical protein VIV11_33935 [Kofleriaceae bacterium]
MSRRTRVTDENTDEDTHVDPEQALEERVTQALPVRPRFDTPPAVREVASDDVTIDEEPRVYDDDEAPTSRRR